MTETKEIITFTETAKDRIKEIITKSKKLLPPVHTA